MIHQTILIKSKKAGSALLIFLASSLFVLALATSSDGKTQTRRSNTKTVKGSFTPSCTLPFKGVRNPPSDDHCGIAGGSSDLAKQAESRAKNNFCASTKSVRVLTYNDFVNLQKRSTNLPAKLPDRAAVRRLGEGQYVSYIAFVSNPHYSDVNAGEAVNCNIPGKTTNDIHIVLLQTPNDDECNSTTAEISPHYRPPGWTPEKLKQASAGHPVRLTGQLFFDGSHKPCSGGSRPNPKRKSVWEIHPLYSVDICSETTIAACRSSAARWTPLSTR
jgi:hypothetical protein